MSLASSPSSRVRPTLRAPRWRTLLRRALALAAGVTVLFLTAHAAASSPNGTVDHLSVHPIFGSELTVADGWADVIVRAGTPAGVPAGGGGLWAVSGSALTAPVAFDALRAPQVVPAHSFLGGIDVVLADAHGARIATGSARTETRTAPSLLIWSTVTSLGLDLRGSEIEGRRDRGVDLKLRIGWVERDPRTGAALAPDSAAVYAAVDVVLLRAEDLAALHGGPLAALTTWVLGGGTLAVVPGARDLTDTPLVAMVGGAIRHTTGTDERPAGFRGGNLRDDALGAVASYGLGEVYLLDFDPLWFDHDAESYARVRELVARGFRRRSLPAFAHAPEGRDPNAAVVRALDPNQGHGRALALAALVLTAYAVLAGPVVHLRARRRRRPLAPLAQVPLLSAGAFALIVVIGVVSKGIAGRARHLTFVESGAGLSRGTGVAYRSFFAGRTTRLAVPSLSPGGRLALVDRHDGAALDGPHGLAPSSLTLRPWRTVVVQEVGFTYELGGGVTIRRLPDGRLIVRNATGRALRDAILSDGPSATYLGSIESGAAATFSEGRALRRDFEDPRRDLPQAIEEPQWALRLASYYLGAAIGGDEGERVRATWQLAEGVAAGSDFWSAEGPVLIAELEGPSSTTHDGGLRLESDRVLLRVVGEGGAP